MPHDAETEPVELTRDDPGYPDLLRQINDSPAVLYVRGQPETLSLPQFAIVGSRNATAAGLASARAFAAHLAACGFSIVSGLALGIDAAAHRGALEGGGTTVAVCATGLDEVYPARHTELAADVAAQGALVSEFRPGTRPSRSRFPRRNRIISGLAVGTLVVEAGLRSGALITARLAAEQGREVFAIPGSIHNPLAKGCHELIRNGAKLVESAQHIVEELPASLSLLKSRSGAQELTPTPSRPSELAPEYQRLLELMAFDPVTINELVTRSGLTADVVSSMILRLEMQEFVEPLAAGRYLQREAGREK